MKALSVLFGSLLFCLIFTPFAYGRQVSITTDKNSLFGEEELRVAASASGFTIGEQIYLKGAFFKESSSNYFGYTKHNGEWIKNSATSTEQFQAKVGEWDGVLYVKNDALDTGFIENGNYKFKVGYYYITSGGNVSSVNWSENILDIALTYPSSTPTPQPTATSQPTHTPSPTITYKIVQPTITTAQIKTSTKPSAPITNSQKNKKSQVLAVATELNSPTPHLDTSKTNEFVFPPVLLLTGLIVIILTCGILLYKEWKKQKEVEL